MAMEKVNPPYRASFSTSNAVVMALTSLCFKVGRLSAVSTPVPLLTACANEAAAYLEKGGKRLSPSQLRGLYRGEDIASVPLARRICSLFVPADLQSAGISENNRIANPVGRQGVRSGYTESLVLSIIFR